MHIAVVTSRYPSVQQPYAYGFVHTRVREYLKKGNEVRVFVPSTQNSSYFFEGVSIHRLPALDIVSRLDWADAVMIHLLHVFHTTGRDGSPIYEHLIREQIPSLFFIHGVEVQRIALSLRDQIVPTQPRSLFIFVYHDFFQIPRMKRYLTQFLERHPRMRFVAVSRWMVEEVRRNLGLNLHPKTVVIPNGIDVHRFRFRDRWPARKRLLALRPLVLKGKYAVDLAIKTMRYVPPEITLDLYGRGPDATKIHQLIQTYGLQKQIRVIERFFPPPQLPSVHEKHGIYYAVTRMDAQGVSMCEAMASGLPVVSFDICGIPEFVKPGETGLLVPPYQVRKAAEAIQRLLEDRALYTRLAEGARRFTESIAIEHTTERELEVAREMIKG